MYLNYLDDEILKNIVNGSMILKFLDSDDFKKINISNLFKISGRYFLNDHFDLTQYINDFNIFKQITDGGSYTNTPCYYSFFYKIDKKYLLEYVNVFKNNVCKLGTNRDDYHCDMEHFLCTYFKDNIKYIDVLGISGNIAVNGEQINH